MSSSCSEITCLLTEYQEGTLPWIERLQVKRHLERCPQCQSLACDLEALPALVQHLESDPAEWLPLAERALEGALQQLDSPRPVPGTPVPEPLQVPLAAGGDLPLRILAQVHEAMSRRDYPRKAPFLPQEVLSQLPSPEQWKWTSAGRARRALLAVDPVEGQRLSIFYAPPKYQIPAHTHQGTESLLVLEGEMEDEDRCLGNGQWIHTDNGSSHAPYIFEEGCWCLIRDEGTIHFDGPLGWLRGLAARITA
jgi:anti-sigma factor ChrR (cupin superfamily)